MMNRPNHKALLHSLVCSACFLLMAAAPQEHMAQQAAEPAREYHIKSAFLYHFLHYAEWSKAENEHELVVCVAGDVPHAAALETLGEKTLQERPVVVRRLDDAQDSGECLIAFFGASAGPVSKDLLVRLQDDGVLTVGENAAFTERGGMIRLYKHRNRLRFEINLEAVRSAGIHMSSRVLALATII